MYVRNKTSEKSKSKQKALYFKNKKFSNKKNNETETRHGGEREERE